MQPATDTIANPLEEAKAKIAAERRAMEASVSVRDPSAFRVPDVERQMGETVYREPRVPGIMVLRDDPLGHMYHKGRHEIRLGRAQYMAGRKWQETYEAAGIGRVRSPSDIREHVDGGGIAHSGATDRQMRAHKLLKDYADTLGREGARLVEAVLADKCTLRQMAQRIHGQASAANIKYVGRRFRECLSTLAKEMGLG